MKKLIESVLIIVIGYVVLDCIMMSATWLADKPVSVTVLFTTVSDLINGWKTSQLNAEKFLIALVGCVYLLPLLTTLINLFEY